jgi:hypothetical protein
MKNIILTILTSVFIIQGCTQKKKDNDIIVFESTLSNKNAKELNEIIKEFDNYLLARFPSNNSIDSSYRLFLTKICLSDDFFLSKSDSLFLVKLRNRFSNSGLQKELLLTPDTMFLINENKGLFRRYIYIDSQMDTVGVINDTFPLPPNPRNIDFTEIDFYNFLNKKHQLQLFNVFGEYFRGLKKIKNRNTFISSYIEEKMQVLIDSGQLRYSGFNDFKLFACGLKSQNIDFSDYFIKRIIVIELLT